jgi:hypothetical protein
MQRKLKMHDYMTGLARAVVPQQIRKSLYQAVLDRRIEQLPSRRFIHETLLPLLAGAGCANLLFVGVQGYNRRVARTCTSLGLALWTIDIDPAAVRWGAADKHIVGDVCEIDRRVAPQFFDAAIMNGVLGYGIDDSPCAEAAIQALATVIKPSAFVVIGWNPGLVADYRDLGATRRLLVPARLGHLHSSVEFPPDAVQSHPHRYDLYQVRKPSNR